MRTLTTQFQDPSNVIDDDNLIYPKPEETDADDTGEVFACCPVGDNGHLFLTACGVTRCVHCKRVVAV